MKKFALFLIMPVVMMLAACAADIGANQYDSSSVGSVTKALRGTVISVRSITVRDSDRSAGTAVGAIAGGIGGSQIGKGSTAALPRFDPYGILPSASSAPRFPYGRPWS